MSRIGRKPIPIAPKVTVDIDGQAVKVTGPKGELSIDVHPNMKVSRQEDDTILVERPDDERQNRALHGLTRALIANMVIGVSDGYERRLIVEGVGYAGEVKNKNLVMKLGFSHEIVVEPPEHVTFAVERVDAKVSIVKITGIDKQVVGQVAANVRGLRPPEPYLGKGVRYSDEVIRRKAGKTGK